MSVVPHLIDSHRLLIFVAVQFAIAISNAILMRPLRSFGKAGATPRVSVLVPARDEEETVEACVRSLLAQDYPDLEVIVLDDESRDDTAGLLAAIRSDRLRVVSGRPLPRGWTGKTWACSQLARLADGELLFFTDADTVHEPDTLRRTVAAAAALKADFVSAVTRTEVRTVGERITVPFVIWSVMAILPLAVAYALPRCRAFAAANGKFMLFSRSVYEAVGGHRAVRDEAAEDLALCRLVKGSGYRWRLVNATECVSSRMYQGFLDAARGFSKNYFALFDYRVLVALFVWCWLLVITWHPLATVVALGPGEENPPEFWSAAATVVLSAAIWLLIAVRTRMPRHLFLLYPVTMTVSSGLGLWSMVLTMAGRTSWKGRALVRHRVRLL